MTAAVAGSNGPGTTPEPETAPAWTYERPDGHRDRGWAFCTLKYLQVRREPERRGWMTDWPDAGEKLMLRIEAITTTRIPRQLS